MVSNMDWVCTECGRSFTNKESYCENWRDADRKFGCPDCHTFFRVERRKMLWQEGVLQSVTIISFIIGINALMTAIKDDQAYYIAGFSIMLIATLTSLVMHNSVYKRNSGSVFYLEKIEAKDSSEGEDSEGTITNTIDKVQT